MSVAPKSSRAVFRKLDQDLDKLASAPDPRSVHRLRTGTRRLQILLDEISPDGDRNQKKLLKLLGRLRKRAGKVRDLDVQLAALRSLKIPQEPRRKTQLMNELIELRDRQEKKLRKAADKTMSLARLSPSAMGGSASSHRPSPSAMGGSATSHRPLRNGAKRSQNSKRRSHWANSSR